MLWVTFIDFRLRMELIKQSWEEVLWKHPDNCLSHFPMTMTKISPRETTWGEKVCSGSQFQSGTVRHNRKRMAQWLSQGARSLAQQLLLFSQARKQRAARTRDEVRPITSKDSHTVSHCHQPGPTSWRAHSPARLYQSGKQAIKMQNVWGTIQMQTLTLMSQWEELRQPAEAKLTQYQDREYSTRGTASHMRIYTWLFFIILTRQRGTIKSILGMGLKEVTRHWVAHRGWLSTINEALAPFCPSLGQALFKAPSNWYLKVCVLSL